MIVKIKSIHASIHDTSYGGYPFKITAIVEITSKDFSKLPVTRREHASMFGPARVHRDLGPLVVQVNNALYAIDRNIWAHNPSVDPRGEKRAKNGVKTMIFEYFSQDYFAAEKLGYEIKTMKSGEKYAPNFQSIDLLKTKGAA